MDTVFPATTQASLELMYGGRLSYRMNGELYLCFGDLHYRARDYLPPQVGERNAFFPRNARQFAALCLLERYGCNADDWPEIARRFTEIN